MMRIKEKSQGNRRLTVKRLQEYNLFLRETLRRHAERKKPHSSFGPFWSEKWLMKKVDDSPRNRRRIHPTAGDRQPERKQGR
jgi:hypothetical protein